MVWADIFVLYDDVQYTKRDWRSRNRIKTASGIQWLTVPVLSKGRRGQLINEVKIDTERQWIKKHVSSIQNAYARAKYFGTYFPDIKQILEASESSLLNLDLNLITYLKETLGIKTKCLLSSSLNIRGTGSEKLLRICRELNIREYLTGDAAMNYLDVDLFRENNIRVHYHHYHHPVYSQLYEAFVPFLSVIDLLFNAGPGSLNIITGKAGALS